MKTRIIIWGLAAMIVATILAACGSGSPTTPTPAPATQPANAPTLAPAAPDGAAILQAGCVQCHSLDRVKRARKTQEQWARTVTDMINKGARLNADEQKALVEYLAKTYGQ